MPLYDFQCLKCNHEVEIRKRMVDPSPTICPACGEDALVQVHKSAPSVEYKGKGWFKTDGKY